FTSRAAALDYPRTGSETCRTRSRCRSDHPGRGGPNAAKIIARSAPLTDEQSLTLAPGQVMTPIEIVPMRQDSGLDFRGTRWRSASADAGCTTQIFTPNPRQTK